MMTFFLTLSIVLNIMLIATTAMYYANLEFLVDELIRQDDEIDELMSQVIAQQDAMAEYIETGTFDPFVKKLEPVATPFADHIAA